MIYVLSICLRISRTRNADGAAGEDRPYIDMPGDGKGI